MKYSIIYADPPWSYNFPRTRKAKNKDYKLMKTSDICNMPVNDIANDDAVLFMWVIWNKLEDALKVIKAWGFTYKSCAFTWVKKNKKSDSYFFGMGLWTRQNSEVCLIATRGKPKRASAGVHSIIDSKIGKHSEKPEEARAKIVELCGNLPRVELFARQSVEGWDVFGNEVENSIKLGE